MSLAGTKRSKHDGDMHSAARVVRPDGRPLPNLYAGGGAARSISGPAVTGYLPAVGLAMAITLGHIAGRAAAQQTQLEVA